MTLPPGAVIPAGGDLYVGREAVGFRARSVSPKADEKRYLVSGYGGQLSARGETINLHDNLGNLIDSETYAGSETASQEFLRITELLYAPTGPTAGELASIPTLSASDFEFIELINNRPVSLDLSGAQFVEGVTMTFGIGSILAPGQRIIVVANQAAFELRNGAGYPIFGEFSGNLSNGGEEIQIIDAVGENILEFSYNDSWYPQTDDDGYALSLLDPLTTPVTDFDQEENWGISQAVGGDPGLAPTVLSMSFEFWKNQEFTPAQVDDPLVVGELVDLDGDTLGTLLEYALGLDPEVANSDPGYSSLIVSDGGIDYQALSFRRQKNVLDLTYVVQVSDDLENWSTISQTVGSPVDNGDGTETVVIRDSLAHPAGQKRFVRLAVTLTP